MESFEVEERTYGDTIKELVEIWKTAGYSKNGKVDLQQLFENQLHMEMWAREQALKEIEILKTNP